jgi:hypothetical protein
MRLTSAQVRQTLRQIPAQVIPDDHPLVPRLTDLFGDHTFFIDEGGLNIVELAAAALSDENQTARVVNVAHWGDSTLTSLAPHEPEPTDAVVKLAPEH